MDGDRVDKDRATRAARRTPGAWRRLVLSAGLGLCLTMSPDSTLEDGVLSGVRAAPLAVRADLRVSFGETDWRVAPNDGFSYRVTVANHGNAAAPAHVETVLHPALSNVTVTGSGFACTRQFEAGGAQPGTAVTCTSWEPLGPGATASFTVRARAAGAPGTYSILARASAEIEGAENAGIAADLHVDS